MSLRHLQPVERAGVLVGGPAAVVVLVRQDDVDGVVQALRRERRAAQLRAELRQRQRRFQPCRIAAGECECEAATGEAGIAFLRLWDCECTCMGVAQATGGLMGVSTLDEAQLPAVLPCSAPPPAQTCLFFAGGALFIHGFLCAVHL